MYRIVMVVLTVSIAWVVKGNAAAALKIAIAANVVKTGMYNAYERVWDRVAWGVKTS